MSEISTRQFIFIALFLGITSKLMSMPVALFESAGNDAIFAIMLNFLVEIGLVVLIAYVIKKHPGIGLFQLLKNSVGKVLAICIIILLFVFIIVKMFFALEEVYTFFKEFLYDYFSPLMFALATFFVIGYLSFKGARTLGRTLEILFPFIMIGLAVTILSNVGFLEFTRQMPYFKEGAGQMLMGSIQNIFYFGNSLPLLFFVGKVKCSDKFVMKTVLSYSGLAVFVSAFCFAYYDIFGHATIFGLFALIDYSQYNPYILDLQRLNWLSIIVNITKLFCSTSILLYCLGQAGKMITGLKSSFWPIVVACAINFTIATFVNYEIDLIKYLVTYYLSYITLGLMVLVALICIIICIKARRKCVKHYSIK